MVYLRMTLAVFCGALLHLGFMYAKRSRPLDFTHFNDVGDLMEKIVRQRPGQVKGHYHIEIDYAARVMPDGITVEIDANQMIRGIRLESAGGGPVGNLPGLRQPRAE